MNYIDEKFKEAAPDNTVDRIKSLLKKVDIELHEKWNDSGVENCESLRVFFNNGAPGTNGKGVTKEFAQASAYGEFIERLQSGLFFYKYQSFECDPVVNMQCYAPDAKYFTKKELEDNAEWFDYLIESYSGLTRRKLAEQCEMYAHTDDGKILCIPFYSLFEDKYVYLPAGFIEHIYSANGCCVGNTKEEALVHALSEIMERKGSIKAITSGESFPEIPDSELNKYPTVSKILKKLRENEDLDIKVFDCSVTKEIPVISTRIIDKKTHGYFVNFAADPVLEIAIQRTLTEIFQGRQIENFGNNATKKIKISTDDIKTSVNVLNQLETGRGSFAADYFAEELTCEKQINAFDDNSGKSNVELLNMVLSLYRRIGKPIYLRNYAFLEFPCYKVIIPGFSESRGYRLTEDLQEYAIADLVSKVIKKPKKYAVEDYSFVLMYKDLISNVFSKSNNFNSISGLPLSKEVGNVLMWGTLAYCAYMTKNKNKMYLYLNALCENDCISEEDRQYFNCVKMYFDLKFGKVTTEKINIILNKFFKSEYVEKLNTNIKNGSPFDEYLLDCDINNCIKCKYSQQCDYQAIRAMMQKVGEKYNQFVDGQNKENFVEYI
ncbi:MAG: YcaO-like family protein [Clostridia bacterium]|nr:YcaO-like family protein [Clostridia bacterium]